MTLLTGNQPVLGAATVMSLLTGPPDSTGGCQSALAVKLGVSPSQYHHPWSTSPVARVEQKARRGRSSETSKLVTCHHGMASPQVVDEPQPPDTKSRREYTE
jgi:hypothetical protein